MKDKIIKLKNGGTLIYSKNKFNNSSAVEVGFCVGAECDKIAGTAHFLEHTLFKKTKNRTNSEVERDRNKIVSLNASTGHDYLIVKFVRTNKLIEQSFEFAYDVLMNSVIDDEYVQSEKGVIKEELAMCQDDESYDVYLENFKQAMSKTKYSSNIVGESVSNIDEITFKDLENFKKKYFVGQNFVISISTSMSLAKTKRLVNKYFAETIKPAEKYVKPKKHFDIVNVDKDSSISVVEKAQEKTIVLMTFKIKANERDIFAGNYNYPFLARYLSSSQGELFLKLRNLGFIYRMSSDISCMKSTSLFNIFLETSMPKVNATLRVVKDEIAKIVNQEIDETLIEEYRKNLEYFADEKIPQSPAVVAHSNLIDYVNNKKLFNLTKKQKKKLREGVNPHDVRKIAQTIFNKNNQMYVTFFGSIVKDMIPDLQFFKDNFLISE